MLHLQRTIGNQAVLRMLQIPAEEPEAGLTGTASPRFGHEFSGIPLHPTTGGAIQTKSAINTPGDEYEQEAGRAAEQVMRMPEPQLQRRCACGRVAGMSGECAEYSEKKCLGLQAKLKVNEPGDSYEHEADLVSERVMNISAPGTTASHGFNPAVGSLYTSASTPGQLEAPPVVRQVLSSPGRPLDSDARLSMEARFARDFSRVRIHTDARAAESAQAVNALAYTVGDHIVFAPSQYAPTLSSGQKLLAHELAHVLQQSAQGSTPRVARQPKPAPPTHPTPVDLVLEAVRQPSPSSFSQAAGELLALPMKDLLSAVAEVRARGALDAFMGLYRVYTVSQQVAVSDRLPAALYAVKWSGSDAGKNNSAEVQLAGQVFANLDPAEQMIVLSYLNKNHPHAAQARLMAEGQAALEEEKTGPEMTATAHIPSGAGMGAHAALPPIGPGPWNLPGDLPIPFYIGTEAHIAIATVYEDAHYGDQTFYNFFEMSAILRAASRMGQVKKPDALNEKEMGLKPDIANLTKHHLYEIKPVDSLALGRAEMKLYLGLFMAAGIPMTPGPITEDGTQGAFPAPAGVFFFESPEPGVIVYRYRKGSLVPELVYETAEATEPSKARWRYVLKPEQKAVIAGTVTVGVGLIILIIVLAPVGA
jgi:Domain of unknown function (DUF4157)